MVMQRNVAIHEQVNRYLPGWAGSQNRLRFKRKVQAAESSDQPPETICLPAWRDRTMGEKEYSDQYQVYD